VPPPEPVDASAALRREIAALQQRLAQSEDAVAQARLQAEAEARTRETMEERLSREADERLIWEQLAQETEAAKVEIAARLASLQAHAQQAPRAEVIDLVARSEEAAHRIDLDEADTRALIDQ
jgi:type I restriction enzyme, R subunit